MPKLQTQLPCDVRRDVVPVVSLGQVDFVRVGHPRHGLRTVQDFTAAARAQPGRFDDPSAGRGSRRHPGMEERAWSRASACGPSERCA